MFQVASTIESISTRSDNTIKIVIGTQELNTEQAVALFQLKGQLGWMLFKESPLETSEVPNEPVPEFKGDKSPSQRIRSALYIYWDKNTSKKITFDEFYKTWAEKKINEIKDTLN